MDEPATAPEPAAEQVLCPVCLERVTWTRQALWRWNSESNRYAPVQVPGDASPERRRQAERGAYVKCPGRTASGAEHYLPANYGRYGKPVILGLVGATQSGKTHLLSAMVGAIEGGALADYGATSRPVDQALHHFFMEEMVRPFLTQGRVLPGTREHVVSFADALLIGTRGGRGRPVALFDVAGGELRRERFAKDGAKNFLAIADGLIFVVDPVQIGNGRLGDDTFNAVLDLLRDDDRLQAVSAAVVLNKGDLLRFDDPVTRWLRTDLGGIDAAQILQESADVFAYLWARGAGAWTRPYQECHQATLHVVSATGGVGPQSGTGATYPRTVAPRRVLGPLIALLTMTGVLGADQARQVGV